ncbi:MAG: type II secretion system protein [Akkermansiaceae bacterium]|nr:type II secretion system protein [Armatimonadota bacterium]
MSSSRTSAGRRRGYTLIEMIVVITILALMAALIIPNFLAMKRSRDIRDAEAALIRLPAEARIEAQRSGSPVTIRVEGEGLVLDRSATAEEPDPVEVKRLKLPDGIRLDAARSGTETTDLSSWQWVVYPDGSAESAGLEFVEGDSARHSLMLPAKPGESSRWLEGGLPQEDESGRWTAGELEQRG